MTKKNTGPKAAYPCFAKALKIIPAKASTQVFHKGIKKDRVILKSQRTLK